MALTLTLVAGVVTGLYFDAFALAAISLALMLVGIACAAGTGAWHSVLTLALGIFVLQVGYAVGVTVCEFELSSRLRARLTPDP